MLTLLKYLEDTFDLNAILRMNNTVKRFFYLFISLFATVQLSAQTNGLLEGTSWLTWAIIGIVGLILISFIVQVANSFLSIEAKSMGIDTEEVNVSVFPKASELFGASKSNHLEGEQVKVLRRGHDILLKGEATGRIEAANVRSFAVQPKNFIGMSPIPKVTVEVGQKVKAGDELFFDKKRPEIKYTSPVSGEVAAINRAEKRSIAEVVILADAKIEYRNFGEFVLEQASREELINFLLESGAWAMIRQRPFNIVADPADVPRDIFISTFDSAPLAPDNNVVVEGREIDFQKGLDALNKLTDGSIYLGLNAQATPSSVFTSAEGVEKVYFKGKHPAGNVGVQIHHIKPLNVGENIWTLGVQEVITIGSLFSQGKFDASRVVALTGAELKEPKYVRTYLGANIGELLKDNLENDHIRIVSGDVLSGQRKTDKQFLNFFDDQITVIEEGDDYELFGWLLPIAPRPTISNTYPNFLFPNQKFKATTNTHGEKRAFVVTSDYEQVMPMDIHVQALMKSIMINDFERMEGLGLLELVEEDVALCEFVCTSKMPLQQILREGLEEMREQG